MKKLFVVAGIVLMAWSVALSAGPPVTHAQITFEIKNLGIATVGSFGGLQSKVHFNPANLNASTLEASVETNTINTDNSSRDEHLRSEDFFDVARFPKISLKSVNFKRKGANNYTGSFILTIKGRSKQVEMPFTFVDKDNTVAFKASFKINRIDFGVGSKSMILSDEVTVNIDCEEKKPELTRI